MTTPEQIQAWAREADLGGLQLNGEDWAVPLGTQRFATLARADLVAERDALMADYNNVSAENEELRTRLLAMACEQVDIENALKAEVEALRKDAARYRRLLDYKYTDMADMLGVVYGSYTLKEEIKSAIANRLDADMEKTK